MHAMRTIRVGETFQAILVRFVLLLHATLSFVIFYANSSHPVYFLCAIPLVLMIIDIAVRYEIKHFWLTGFLYISSLVPIIICIETEMVETRIQHLAKHNQTEILNQFGTSEKHDETRHDTITYLLNLPRELVAKKLCEIGLLIGLIIGRAIAPRGDMTHDQLSSLLLGFVSNCADLVDVLETLTYRAINLNRTVTYVVLAIFSFSIYQFTFNPYTNDGTKKDNIRQRSVDGSDTNREVLQGESGSSASGSKYGSFKNVIQNANCCGHVYRFCNIDVFSNMILLLMHDGPLFLVRVVLIFTFHVRDEINTFFMIKNGLVVVLLVYHLLSLCFCREDDEDVERIPLIEE